MAILAFLIFVALVVVIGIFAARAARKRREAMAILAQRLGLNFDPAHDYGLASRFQFLGRLGQGSNRYAYNVLSGAYQGKPVLAFDYHYETYSRDSKGHRQTHHHHFSFFILLLDRSFPELLIAPEGVLSKLAQAFGYDDIDFESHEFSRKFCVRSRDKKFAYDFCHARMIEYLLARPNLSLEIEDNALAIGHGGTLSPEELEPQLRQLIEIRLLMPQYLFTTA